MRLPRFTSQGAQCGGRLHPDNPHSCMSPFGALRDTGKTHILVDVAEAESSGKHGPPGDKHRPKRYGSQALLVAFSLPFRIQVLEDTSSFVFSVYTTPFFLPSFLLDKNRKAVNLQFGVRVCCLLFIAV